MFLLLVLCGDLEIRPCPAVCTYVTDGFLKNWLIIFVWVFAGVQGVEYFQFFGTIMKFFKFWKIQEWKVEYCSYFLCNPYDQKKLLVQVIV